MKLYTEEQVIDAINKSFLIEYPSTGNDILNELIPIELPSDEEIVNKALEIEWSNTLFKDGANYVLNKIQGGNNEQR